MKKICRSVGVGLVAALAVGCYHGNDGFSETGLRNIAVNNIYMNNAILNGINLQGINLQGINLQGINLQGINLQGINLQGINLQGINLQGSSFTGYTLENGEEVYRYGEDLSGMEFELKIDGTDADNNQITETYFLHIDDIYRDPDSEFDDVLHYYVSYRAEKSNVWTPLCLDSEGNETFAIPMANYWDESTGNRIDDADVVTFACAEGVLAKCVEWGYRPWGESQQCKKWDKGKKCETVSLQDYHQACTRMARADYCGDGTPWTVAGTAIDIYDHLYPQIESPESQGWQIEAEWNPDGAYCLQDIRQQGWKAEGLYPKCKNKSQSSPRSDYGSLKHHRALIVSAFEKDKKGKGKGKGKGKDKGKGKGKHKK